MQNLLKKILTNNVQLKLFSLILGYLCWSIVSQSHTDNIWIDAPVCFYETADNQQIHAPETIKINLTGKRCALRAIDRKSTAVHIDTHDLKLGKHVIALSERNMLLPETVQVIGWAPTHVPIKIEKKIKTLTT